MSDKPIPIPHGDGGILAGHGFGTAPVFLASISTILGAVMFLRFGYAVGHLGALGTIGLILLGHLVTIPTAMAIVTPAAFAWALIPSAAGGWLLLLALAAAHDEGPRHALGVRPLEEVGRGEYGQTAGEFHR